MATSYTTNLELALPTTGELAGTWGEVVNDNITSMVEEAITGIATIDTWTADAHALTTSQGTTSESRCAILHLTDTGTALTGAGTLTTPDGRTKVYIVKNDTGQTITVKTTSGTGLAIPTGTTAWVYSDGTDIIEATSSYVVNLSVASLTATTADINGGTIDGTTIGATTPAAGNFSTVDIDGGTIDGTTIGATTAAAGTFTGLTVNGAVSISASNPVLSITDTSNPNTFELQNQDSVIRYKADVNNEYAPFGGSRHEFYGDGVKNMVVAATGDVDFFDSTGTNARFHWDAADERLGIGTTTPAWNQTINSSLASAVYTQYTNSVTGTAAGDGTLFGVDASGNGTIRVRDTLPLIMYTDDTERTRIDASGTLIHKAAAVFNEDGGDSDFRVESVDRSDMFKVDAALNRVIINSGGGSSDAALSVTGQSTFSGYQVIGTRSFASMTAATDYYLFTLYPTNNGSSAGALLSAFNTNNTTTALTQFTARNASGTTSVSALTMGTNDSNLTYIGYRDNADASKVHIYARPAGTLSYTPQFTVTGTGNVAKLADAPATPVDDDWTWDAITAQVGRLQVNSGGLTVYRQGNNTSGGTLRLAGSSTDATSKYGTLTAAQYSSDAEPEGFLIIGGTGGDGLNYVNMGGGVDEQNLATRTRIYGGAPNVSTRSSGSYRLAVDIDSSEIVMNQNGEDWNFRVESDSNSHMLFVDAGSNAVGINNSSPSHVLDIKGQSPTSYTASSTSAALPFSAGHAVLRINNTQNTDNTGAFITLDSLSGNGTSNPAYIGAIANNGLYTPDIVIGHRTGSTAYKERLNIDSIGQFNFTTGGDISFYGDNGVNDDVYLKFGSDDSVGATTPDRARIQYSASNNNTGNLYFWTKKDAAAIDYSLQLYGNAGAVFNESGTDYMDFRVESDTSSHLLFVDASANSIGINLSTPSSDYKLDVNGDIKGKDFRMNWNNSLYTIGPIARSSNQYVATFNSLEITGADGISGAQAMAGGGVILRAGKGLLNGGAGAYGGDVQIKGGAHLSGAGTAGASAGRIRLFTDDLERVTIGAAGDFTYSAGDGRTFVINEGSADIDFRVETNNETAAIHTDGANDVVNFFTTATYSGSNVRMQVGEPYTGGTATQPSDGTSRGHHWRMNGVAHNAISGRKDGSVALKIRLFVDNYASYNIKFNYAHTNGGNYDGHGQYVLTNSYGTGRLFTISEDLSGDYGTITKTVTSPGGGGVVWFDITLPASNGSPGYYTIQVDGLSASASSGPYFALNP